MSKHAGYRKSDGRIGAAVATIAVVGVLGVVVAALAAFRPEEPLPVGAPEVSLATQQAGSGTEQGTTDPTVAAVTSGTTDAPGATDATTGTTTAAPPAQRILAAETIEPQRVGESQGHRLRRRAEQLAEQEPTTFKVSTFNVLGASHTGKGGNKGGWAPATTRMGWTVSILREHDVDVVGFQEFEQSQYHSFVAQTDGRWNVYPGMSGDPRAVRNSIAWRSDTWELVDASTIPIPYFRGNRIPMPYVLLRNLGTDQEVYFINVHNPASTPRWGENERWRDAATALEVGLIDRLHATGRPVVLTGDFNERDEVFCKVTADGSMRAANGGSVGGGCAPPPAMNVDWIFGSAGIEFTGYLSQKSGLVQRATDHPFVVSTATIQPESGGAAGG